MQFGQTSKTVHVQQQPHLTTLRNRKTYPPGVAMDAGQRADDAATEFPQAQKPATSRNDN